MQTPDWVQLSIPGTELLEARLECHQAVQINTRLTRGFLPFPLDGYTFEEALGWVGEHLRVSGLDPAPLALPIHFKLDDRLLLHGARFRLRGREHMFEELAKWYSNAALCLNATQIGSSDRSMGVGMSPGDGSYAQPYFYVSPWPSPDVSTLPPLAAGHWHTAGWVGAVLTAEEILPNTDQHSFVATFIQGAMSKG